MESWRLVCVGRSQTRRRDLMQATLNEQMTQILSLSGATSVRAPSLYPSHSCAHCNTDGVAGRFMGVVHGFRLACGWVGHIEWWGSTRLQRWCHWARRTTDDGCGPTACRISSPRRGHRTAGWIGAWPRPSPPMRVGSTPRTPSRRFGAARKPHRTLPSPPPVPVAAATASR